MELSVEAALQSLLKESAWETRVRIATPEVRVLVFRRPSEQALWIELWPGSVSLLALRTELQGLGFQRRRFADGARTFGRTLNAAEDISALVAAVERVLALVRAQVPVAGPNAMPTPEAAGDATGSSTVEVPGMNGEAQPGSGSGLQVEIKAQRGEPPTNPRLLEAMRAAANHQDERTRQRLYAALVNATLLVPIDLQTVDEPPFGQLPLALTDGVYGAFTDWDALRQWAEEGHPFGLVHGTDFFMHVADQGGSVRVNPSGSVGGELYPSEVVMMAEAVRGYLRDKH